MDYGKIEIEKISNIESYTSKLLDKEWIYSENEQSTFKEQRECTKNWILERYYNDVKTSLFDKYIVAQRHLSELATLNIFSVRMYNSLLNNVFVDDLGNYFSADSFGSFFGKLEAMKEIEKDSTEPERTNNRITFYITKTEFVELVKALIENKAVIGRTDKEVIEYFSKVLDVKITSNEFYKIANKFKENRTIGNEAIFLSKLEYSFTTSLKE